MLKSLDERDKEIKFIETILSLRKKKGYTYFRAKDSNFPKGYYVKNKIEEKDYSSLVTLEQLNRALTYYDLPLPDRILYRTDFFGNINGRIYDYDIAQYNKDGVLIKSPRPKSKTTSVNNKTVKVTSINKKVKPNTRRVGEML